MCILYLMMAVYPCSSGALNKINKEQLKGSTPIKFDFILDEDLSIDEPRIKSIIYCSKTHKRSSVEISYENPNAKDVAIKLADVLSKAGLNVLKPNQVHYTDNKETISRYITLHIIY